MSINASAGAKIFLGPTTAVANGTNSDMATAYAALTPYTEIKEVETLGEFGDSAQVISFTSLSDSRVRKLKGAKDAGDLQLVVASDPLDAGQTALIAAEGTDFSYAFKVILSDAADANDTDSVIYFHAKVMSKRLGVGGANDVTKRTFVLGIDTKLVEVPSTAAP